MVKKEDAKKVISQDNSAAGYSSSPHDRVDDIMSALDKVITQRDDELKASRQQKKGSNLEGQEIKEKESLGVEMQQLEKENKKIMAPTPPGEDFDLTGFIKEQENWEEERKYRNERMNQLKQDSVKLKSKPGAENKDKSNEELDDLLNSLNNGRLSNSGKADTILKQDNELHKVETAKASENLASQEGYKEKMSQIQKQAASEEKQIFVEDALDRARSGIEKYKGVDIDEEEYDRKMLEIQHKKNKYLTKASELSQEYAGNTIEQQPLSLENKTKALEIGNVAVDSYVAKAVEDKRLRLPMKIEKLKVAVSMFVDHVKDFATNKIDKKAFVERVKDNWAVADTMVMAGKGVRKAEQNKQSQR